MKPFRKSHAALSLFSLLVCGGLLAACEGLDEPQDYQSAHFAVDGKDLLASGVIDAAALARFREAVENNDDLERLVLLWVPGSADDEANLELARSVRALGLTTEVPPGGLVASGGTDLFLAGRDRRIASDACVGVHSWGDGDGIEGADLPRNDPEHEPYLLYYADMGVDLSFYWFTLEAAGVDSIHWMTPTELRRFRMETAAGTPQSHRAWPGQDECDARLPE